MDIILLRSNKAILIIAMTILVGIMNFSKASENVDFIETSLT